VPVPEFIQKLTLRNYAIAVFHEVKEDLKWPVSEVNRLTFLRQKVFLGLQEEVAKRKRPMFCGIH
jgi:hypothetical protein